MSSWLVLVSSKYVLPRCLNFQSPVPHLIQFLFFIPIVYMAFTSFKQFPPNRHYVEDEDPLIPPGTFSTNLPSGLTREYRESSIGYISDSSEFLR